LISAVLLAYDIPFYRLSLPADFPMQTFDFEAKMPASTTRTQFNVMLQNPLAECFGLKTHWTSKEVNTYTLAVAKGGPKVKSAAPDAPRTSNGVPAGAPGPLKVGPDG